MRKMFLFAAACALIAGCAGAKNAQGVKVSDGKRPDWVSGDSADYPRATYMLGVGLGDDAAGAGDRARGQIAQIFSSLVSVTSKIEESESHAVSDGVAKNSSSQDISDNVRTTSQKMLEGVEIVQTWQDSQTKQYYALAVLNRAKAAASFRQKLADLDMQITGWESSFNSAADKFTRAKAAAGVLALLKQRDGLASDLRTISGSGSGTDTAPEQVAAYKKALADLNITVAVTGAGGGQIATGIIKALNAAGFTALASSSSADISVAASVEPAQIRKDEPGPWKWAQNTVTVALSEAATGKVFVQFDVVDKQAATDLDTAFSRSVQSAAGKTADRIQAAIQDYFGGK